MTFEHAIKMDGIEYKYIISLEIIAILPSLKEEYKGLKILYKLKGQDRPRFHLEKAVYPIVNNELKLDSFCFKYEYSGFFSKEIINSCNKFIKLQAFS